MIFPPLPPPPSTPHSLRQSPDHCSCPWVMRVSSLATPFLYCTLHLHSYCITTYLYFFIFSPLHPFPYMPPPSGNHQNALCIHNSVSVFLVCLVCFLDSIVDRYVFIAILFIVLTLFLFLSPFNISYNNGLVMMNSFSFLVYWKLFICPSVLNDSFAG